MDLKTRALTLLGIASWGEQFMFRKANIAPTPYKRHKRRSSGRSGIPSIQTIRMAENRKQTIKGKQRRAAKKMLLLKRKLKQESIK